MCSLERPCTEVVTRTFGGDPLIIDGASWWSLPVDISRLISVEADSTAIDIAGATLRWRQIGVPGSVSGPLIIKAEWGPGWRGESIDGSAIAQTDEALTTPSPEPDWWQEGGVLIVDEELIVLGEATTVQGAMLRARIPLPTLPSIGARSTPRTRCKPLARRWRVGSIGKSRIRARLRAGARCRLDTLGCYDRGSNAVV